mmetsp:Transcript_29210/g.41108  ORF Transcript_29210/g.41108 Transcript_29210/m.41108 type:complete len:85 (+) Transcript_29210:783-1037(+)
MPNTKLCLIWYLEGGYKKHRKRKNSKKPNQHSQLPNRTDLTREQQALNSLSLSKEDDHNSNNIREDNNNQNTHLIYLRDSHISH